MGHIQRCARLLLSASPLLTPSAYAHMNTPSASNSALLLLCFYYVTAAVAATTAVATTAVATTAVATTTALQVRITSATRGINVLYDKGASFGEASLLASLTTVYL